MNLTLADDEAESLAEILHDYLIDLNRETAHTDSKEFRRLLVKRAEVCERLLERLQQTVPAGR